MEYENHHTSERYATRGVGGAGLGLGIAGTALGIMAGGLNGTGLLGGTQANRSACPEDHFVNRYEAAQQARIAELETEAKLRDSNVYTDGKILDLYKWADAKFGMIESQLCDQKVYNATNTAAISCIQSQIAQLASLTKIVVPNSAICPGWGNVTVTPTTTTTTA